MKLINMKVTKSINFKGQLVTKFNFFLNNEMVTYSKIYKNEKLIYEEFITLETGVLFQYQDKRKRQRYFDKEEYSFVKEIIDEINKKHKIRELVAVLENN